MDAGPTPLACTRSPHKGWSPKKGAIFKSENDFNKWTNNQMDILLEMAGYRLPATATFRPAAVLPAPALIRDEPKN